MAETRSKSRKSPMSIVKPAERAHDANTQQMTLLIISGDPTLVKLEEALYEFTQQKSEDLMKLGFAPRKLQIQIIPTLDPKRSFQGQIPSQVDYIAVMLDLTDPTALDTAELETSLIDKTIVGRHRVGYYFWERSNTVYEHFHQKLQEFSKKFGTSFDSIRFDDEESLEYNARSLYNRIHRLTTNPFQ